MSLQVVDLVLDPVTPDLEADPFAFLDFEGIPIDVLHLADASRSHGRKVKTLAALGTIVGTVVLLENDWVVDDHDQTDRRDALGRGDPDLPWTERRIARDLEPRPNLSRAAPPSARAVPSAGGSTGSNRTESPRKPGLWQSNAQAPSKFSWPEMRSSTEQPRVTAVGSTRVVMG